MRLAVGLALTLALATVASASEPPSTETPPPARQAELDCSLLRNYLKCQIRSQAEGPKGAREERGPNVTVAPRSGSATTSGTGVKVYSAGQCIGAIVNGVCHGTIMPNGVQPKTCHGQMINGACTGPMF